jgi:hypothetical protein
MLVLGCSSAPDAPLTGREVQKMFLSVSIHSPLAVVVFFKKRKNSPSAASLQPRSAAHPSHHLHRASCPPSLHYASLSTARSRLPSSPSHLSPPCLLPTFSTGATCYGYGLLHRTCHGLLHQSGELRAAETLLQTTWHAAALSQSCNHCLSTTL